MRLWFSLCFLSFLSFTACKKQKETELRLSLYSFVNDNVIVDADVAFYVKSVSGNTFSNSFELMDSGKTDWKGEYLVGLSKTSSDIAYQFRITKAGFLTKVVELSPDMVDAATINDVKVAYKPIAEMVFKLVWGTGAMPGDQVFFSFNNDQEVGESYNNLSFSASQIDTLLTTIVLADQYNHYSYVLNRNGVLTQVNDSVYCAIGGNVFQLVEF